MDIRQFLSRDYDPTRPPARPTNPPGAPIGTIEPQER
jgi:hypothetical protein